MRLLKQAAIFAALMFGLASTAMAIVPAMAFAQEIAVATAPEPNFTQQILLALVPTIGLIITALLGWAVNQFTAKTGIEIEAKHREALHSAALNGLIWALQKAGWLPGTPMTDQILAHGRAYIESSVPDALKQFRIDPASSVGKATLDRILTSKAPLPVGTVMPNGDTLIGRAN